MIVLLEIRIYTKSLAESHRYEFARLQPTAATRIARTVNDRRTAVSAVVVMPDEFVEAYRIFETYSAVTT